MNAAQRLDKLDTYFFASKLREIRARESSGQKIIHLGIGSPDMMPHNEVIEALNLGIRGEESFRYKPYTGIPALRAAISNWYKKVYDVSFSERSCLPLIGSKEGIGFVSLAYLNAGDEVLIPDPGYTAYAASAHLAGATVCHYDLTEVSGWQPDLDQLEELVTSRTKLLWINYPHMPTGTQADLKVLARVIDFARRHNIIVCCDNPYSLILADTPFSIFQIEGAWDVAIELNSLSKSHNLAGARLGMVVGSENLVKPVFRVQSNFSSGMFEPLQHAAVAALESDENWTRALNAQYLKRRRVAYEILDLLDCQYRDDGAGLFIWAKVGAEFSDGDALANYLLDSVHVFVTQGSAFGENGKNYIRMSLCAPLAQMHEAHSRITNHNTQLKVG